MNSRPLQSITPAVKVILIINIGIFLLANMLGERIDLAQLLGMHLPGAEQYAVYQYVTHMFTHTDLMHVFFNMFAVFMFGRVLEHVWGQKRFLVYYFATGLGAALLHSLVSWYELHQLQEMYSAFQETPDVGLFAEFAREIYGKQLPVNMTEALNEWATRPETSAGYIAEARGLYESTIFQHLNITTIGASGAVFGLLLAFGMLFPNTELMLMFIPVPIKAKYFVIGYGAIELFLGLQHQAGDNVAHFAHLGGMLFGFFIVRYWRKHGKYFY
ncbi:MAG: rhomboid family intramembrane serine protease [Odoribacteraceae bacterium]|jgi:membrane associated rhomboid family serine protease|nr:rhomboid family intramembrane serine protease [Odoribacteraceae bacterium]